MNKGRLTVFLLLLQLLFACDDPEPPVPQPEPQDCQVMIGDNNMVVDLVEGVDSLVLHLEDGKQLSLASSCISRYRVDSAAWQIKLVYPDSSIQLLPFFAHSLFIHSDSIQLNPYGRAPLAALVSFTLPLERRVKMRVHGIDAQSKDLEFVFDNAGPAYSLPVFGLYPDHQNKVTFSVLDNSGMERSSSGIFIPTEAPGRITSGSMTVRKNLHSQTSPPEFYFIQNAIYDEQGYIRWYSELFGFRFYPMANGLIAIQLYNDKGEEIPTEKDIAVMDLLGKVHAWYDVPNRAHHEIIEKEAGGNLLVGTNAQTYHSIEDDTEDAIVEIDRASGEPVRFWNLREIFDPERPRLWEERPNDWCHLNSIEYDEKDQTLLVSSKLQYFIAKFNYHDQRLKWIFGNHENWKEEWQPYLLSPLNFDTIIHSDRDWTYAQHMARMTGDGNIIVYDNGKLRPGGGFTRILEFRVDTLAMTVEKVWTHDFDFDTRTQGSVQVLDNGHILVGHGEIGLLSELNREGEIIFEARLSVFYRAYPFELYAFSASMRQ